MAPDPKSLSLRGVQCAGTAEVTFSMIGSVVVEPSVWTCMQRTLADPLLPVANVGYQRSGNVTSNHKGMSDIVSRKKIIFATASVNVLAIAAFCVGLRTWVTSL